VRVVGWGGCDCCVGPPRCGSAADLVFVVSRALSRVCLLASSFSDVALQPRKLSPNPPSRPCARGVGGGLGVQAGPPRVRGNI